MYDFHGPDGRWREIPGAQPADFDDATRAVYLMGALANDAVGAARDVFSRVLDYSPNSIAALEMVLARLYDDRPKGLIARLLKRVPSEDEIHDMALPWGAYFGEVMRLKHGAVWVTAHPAAPGEPGYYMDVQGTTIAPVSKVFKRLADGPADNVAFFYKVLVERLLPQSIEAGGQ